MVLKELRLRRRTISKSSRLKLNIPNKSNNKTQQTMKANHIKLRADHDLYSDPAYAAYIIYWDYKHRVILEQTMHAETLYPLNIIEAIKVFAPNGAAGANVDFQLVDGNFTNTLVIEF